MQETEIQEGYSDIGLVRYVFSIEEGISPQLSFECIASSLSLISGDIYVDLRSRNIRISRESQDRNVQAILAYKNSKDCQSESEEIIADFNIKSEYIVSGNSRFPEPEHITHQVGLRLEELCRRFCQREIFFRSGQEYRKISKYIISLMKNNNYPNQLALLVGSL